MARPTQSTLHPTGFLAGVALATLALPTLAHARPVAPSIVCASYPDAPDCSGRMVDCSTCHTSTWPPAWNDYGLAVLGAIDGDFEARLPFALRSLDALDSDGDGVTNADELLLGTSPGDAEDAWPWCPPAAPTGEVPVPERFDFRHALRRAAILYCGRQPTFEELTAFDGDAPARAVLYERLHAVVETCLESDAWTREGLPRLADARIRPIGAVGVDTPVRITIGDYEWDYRLFRYVMTEGRDVRDLLLADYHVDEAPDGTLSRREGTFTSAPSTRPVPAGQPLEVGRRAGMITTQWFLSVNTMFSSMPRTTAAQAYRAWLGFDIAHQEGLSPIAGEPLDVDGKGVAEQQCATCHSTLDPLSYAFASYEGIAGARTGAFDARRPAREIPGWSDPPSYLLGEPVSDVRAWAERAVETEAFQRNLAMMLFRHALGREPTPAELPELRAAWRALPDDGWSANRLVHRLVDTSAFGAR